MSEAAGRGDLVRAAQSGQPEAISELVATWSPRVLAWCRRMGGPHIEPEDAAQDAMTIAIDRLQDLREPASFSGWMYRITKTVLRTHRRRSLIKRWTDIPIGLTRSTEPSPAVLSGRNDVQRKVRSALASLPEAQREALVLVDIEGRTAHEASTMLSIPIGTVKSRLRLGRTSLRASAERHGLHAGMLDLFEGARHD